MFDTMNAPLLLTALVTNACLCFGQNMVWQSPSPNLSEATALLNAVCPDSIRPAQNRSGSLPVCRPCPKYTTDGQLQSRMENQESFTLRSVIYGSFTLPGVEEAVASFYGCEPHASGFGGSILLRKRRGTWRMVDYTPALITSACQTYRLETGRDLLLCEGEDHHMDEASQWVFVCDLPGEPQPSGSTGVFSVLDTRNACGDSAVWGSIDRGDVRDLNADGMPDLTLWISVSQGTFPKAGGACNAQALSTSVRKYALEFLFHRDTNNFFPAPGSKTVVEHLQALFKDAGEKAARAVSPGSSR